MANSLTPSDQFSDFVEHMPFDNNHPKAYPEIRLNGEPLELPNKQEDNTETETLPWSSSLPKGVPARSPETGRVLQLPAQIIDGVQSSSGGGIFQHKKVASLQHGEWI